MFSPFRTVKNFVVYSIIALVVMLAAAWWLWGDDARHHLAALTGAARTEALKAEPYGIRRDAIDGQIAEAKREAEQLAGAIGQLRGELTTVDSSIERLERSQSDDRVLLTLLKEKLVACPPDGILHLSGKVYTRADVEQDAKVILDRHATRSEEISAEEERRAELAEHADTLRSTLRDRLARIRGLEAGQKRAANLIEQSRFNQWVRTLDGYYRPDSRVLTSAERDQQKLLADLTRRSVGLKVVNELLQGGPTPVIDSIATETEPPVDEQIEQLLGQTKDK